MYMEELCTIKKTDDGKFIVQVMSPKKESKAKKGEPAMAMPMEDPKTFVAEDVDELAELIREHASKGKKKSPDDEFAKGYKS